MSLCVELQVPAALYSCVYFLVLEREFDFALRVRIRGCFFPNFQVLDFLQFSNYGQQLSFIHKRVMFATSFNLDSPRDAWYPIESRTFYVFLTAVGRRHPDAHFCKQPNKCIANGVNVFLVLFYFFCFSGQLVSCRFTKTWSSSFSLRDFFSDGLPFATGYAHVLSKNSSLRVLFCNSWCSWNNYITI